MATPQGGFQEEYDDATINGTFHGALSPESAVSFSGASSSVDEYEEQEEREEELDDMLSRPSWAEAEDEREQVEEEPLVEELRGDHRTEAEAEEVAMHAWVELSIHGMHAATQARLALGLQYAIIGINLATALMATIEAQVVVDDLGAAVADHTDASSDVSGLRPLMVVLPLASGLCLALLKGFNFGTKAATLEYSSAAMRSEIYRWRTRTGEYVSTYARSRHAEKDESMRKDELRCRKRFREQISHLQMGDAPAWHGSSTAEGEAATAKPAASIFASLGLVSDGGKRVLPGVMQFAGEAQRVAQVARDRELAALYRGQPLVAETRRPYQQLASAAGGGLYDNGWGVLDHVQYIEFRSTPVIGMYRSKVPELELQLQACQLSIFCLTALCVLLSAMDVTLWLPWTLLLTSSIAAVSDALQLQAKLLATNRALAQLKELQLWWSSLEQDDRKDPFSFDVLVDGVETA